MDPAAVVTWKFVAVDVIVPVARVLEAFESERRI